MEATGLRVKSDLPCQRDQGRSQEKSDDERHDEKMPSWLRSRRRLRLSPLTKSRDNTAKQRDFLISRKQSNASRVQDSTRCSPLAETDDGDGFDSDSGSAKDSESAPVSALTHV
jgi:hypothetical protein